MYISHSTGKKKHRLHLAQGSACSLHICGAVKLAFVILTLSVLYWRCCTAKVTLGLDCPPWIMNKLLTNLISLA